MKELSKYTNPQNVGPGVWFILHCISFCADENKFNVDKYTLFGLVEHIKKYFPCEECKRHFSKMINDNPLRKDRDFFQKVFFWHKTVNCRLKKDTPTHELARESYREVLEGHNYINPECYKTKTNMGMGLWWLLHSSAQHNIELFETVWNLLKNIKSCHDCKETVNNTALTARSKYPDMIWELHTQINHKLNKENVDRDVVLKFFKDNEACTHGCGNGNNKGRYIGI